MILRTEPSWFCGSFKVLRKSGVQAAAFLLIVLSGGGYGWPQNAASLPYSPGVLLNQTPAEQPPSEPENGTLNHWLGLPMHHISFEGVDPSHLDPLPGHLAQAEGAPLNPEDVRKSLRQLFATGLFETIEVEGVAQPDGVSLIFHGTPRTFIGTVSVDGAKGATMNTQLSRATQLAAGHRFTAAKLTQALAEMRSTLADNGFHEPQITQNLTPHPEDQLIDIAFHVVSGPQARIGYVQVTGDAGMSAEEFRRYAHLRTGARIDHDTPNRALSGVLKHYRSQERLEAEIKLESAVYDSATKRTNFQFSATQGPTVKVKVQGVSLSQERIRHVIPIYEEGTVDEDLLLEGNRRLRDLYQRMGYFDVKVDHRQQSNGVSPTSSTGMVEIVYSVDLGPRRRVEHVDVAGNHYFDSATLKELLSVHPAGNIDHHGAYSQAMVSADMSALQAVYRNNGFSKVKITPETSTPETVLADNSTALNPDIRTHITGQTPPTFLLQDEDDHEDRVEDSLSYYTALKAAGIPVEMHLYAQGGHAFGLRRTQFPVTAWPQLVETWLKTIRMIPN